MMGSVSSDRERLRTTFNFAARLYHQARPEYPAALYDELVRLAGLGPGDRLLEVGCATGKATIPLARRGFPITCIEIGDDLAAEARHNLGRLSRCIHRQRRVRVLGTHARPERFRPGIRGHGLALD